MRLSVVKKNGRYTARIWHKQELVFVQNGYSSREAATLDVWTNALFIRDIESLTIESVCAANGF